METTFIKIKRNKQLRAHLWGVCHNEPKQSMLSTLVKGKTMENNLFTDDNFADERETMAFGQQIESLKKRKPCFWFCVASQQTFLVLIFCITTFICVSLIGHVLIHLKHYLVLYTIQFV